MMPIRPIDQISTTGTTTDPNYPTQWKTPVDMSTPTYSVAGDCLGVECKVSDFHFMRADSSMSDQEYNDYIKRQLCQLLVEEMMESRYIEFTSEYSNLKDEIIFRARIFATPDGQVRMLRQLKVIK
jgi:hypothetical protein